MSVRDRPAPLPAGLGRLFEPIYRAALARRNRAFDRGEGVTALDVPVISVGNLSVGGTGKTPMVKTIVRWLVGAGASPAIAMRGYRAEPGERSDEEQEYASSFAGVPIVAQPDRLEGLRPLLAQRAVSCVVLDDGFQHRRIARDLDIVLLDASRNVFADRCLPAGWLREPVRSLERAGAIVFTHVESTEPDSVDAQIEEARAIVGDQLPIAQARHTWDSIDTLDGEKPPSILRGVRAILACGIGHPSPFIAEARRQGVEIIETALKRDHHRWTEAEVLPLLERAGDAIILTTAKDWSTMSRIAPPEAPIWRPRLQLELGDSESALRSLVFETLSASRSSPKSPATIPARG